jgi:hypothetical protein
MSIQMAPLLVVESYSLAVTIWKGIGFANQEQVAEYLITLLS